MLSSVLYMLDYSFCGGLNYIYIRYLVKVGRVDSNSKWTKTNKFIFYFVVETLLAQMGPQGPR